MNAVKLNKKSTYKIGMTEIIRLTSKHVHKITSTIKKCEEFCL